MDNIHVPYVNLVLQHRAIKSRLLASVERVLDHGKFILGPEVRTFEDRFASFCGSKYAVGVDNGTNALSLVLKALDIGQGDEVITPPNSFLASTSSIALTGARPVFVDVREDYNINPNLIQAAITPRTRAILPVHLTGRPADMHPIMGIADEHDIHVIEDCAQAVGARYYDTHVGNSGMAGCFSLHPLKTLNAVGDGGVITTNDEGLYRKLRQARNHGLRNRDECESWSLNSRLDTIQAAMLLAKMDYLPAWTEGRRAIAAFYRKHLEGMLKLPLDLPHEYAVYHTFIVRTRQRDKLQRCLREHGVETKVHYPIPIHLQDAARHLGYTKGDFPVTERLTGTILSLPIYPELATEQLEHVVNTIREFFGGMGAEVDEEGNDGSNEEGNEKVNGGSNEEEGNGRDC